jgi:hypothetical protein
MIKELRQSRENFVNLLINPTVTKINGSERIDSTLADYSQAKKALSDNKNVNALIDNPNYLNNPKSPELSEKLCTEYLFYDYFMELYPPSNDSKSQIDFYNKLKELHKDVLGQEIRVEPKIEQLSKTEKTITVPPYITQNQVLETEPSHMEPKRTFNEMQYNPSRIQPPVKHLDTNDDYDHSLEKIKEVFDIKPANNTKSMRESKPPISEYSPAPINSKSKKPPENNVKVSPHLKKAPNRIEEYPEEDDEFEYETYPKKNLLKVEPMVQQRPETKTNPQQNNKNEGNGQRNNFNKEINQLYKEKLDLTQEINDLAAKKLEFERKLKNAEKNAQQSKIENSHGSVYRQGKVPIVETNSLAQIKKKKDLDISELSKKIKKLEDNFKDPIYLQNPISDIRKNKFSTPSKIQPAQSFIHESRSLMKSSNINSIENGSKYKPAERSGTTFVNQMFSDIDRTLSRGGSKYQAQSLAHSYYQY